LDKEKNHDSTSLILITAKVKELCVVSHSMQKPEDR